jgi:hypothetical protein
MKKRSVCCLEVVRKCPAPTNEIVTRSDLSRSAARIDELALYNRIVRRLEAFYNLWIIGLRSTTPSVTVVSGMPNSRKSP